MLSRRHEHVSKPMVVISCNLLAPRARFRARNRARIHAKLCETAKTCAELHLSRNRPIDLKPRADSDRCLLITCSTGNKYLIWVTHHKSCLHHIPHIVAEKWNLTWRVTSVFFFIRTCRQQWRIQGGGGSGGSWPPPPPLSGKYNVLVNYIRICLARYTM